jgi:hypothetical protein
MHLLICWIDTWAHYRGLEDILDIEDPDPRWFSDYPNPPLTRSPPRVRLEYAQDEFRSPADRPTLRESIDAGGKN